MDITDYKLALITKENISKIQNHTIACLEKNSELQKKIIEEQEGIIKMQKERIDLLLWASFK